MRSHSLQSAAAVAVWALAWIQGAGEAQAGANRPTVVVTTGGAEGAVLEVQAAVLQALKVEPRLVVLAAESWPATVDAILSLREVSGRGATRAELRDRAGQVLLASEVSLVGSAAGPEALVDEIATVLLGDRPRPRPEPSVQAGVPEPGSVEETWTAKDFPASTPGNKKEAPTTASCHGAPAAAEATSGLSVALQYTSFAFPEGRGWYETTAPQFSYAPLSWLLLQARVPLHYLRVAGSGPAFGPGDAEIDARAELLGGKDQPFLVSAGLTGMLPSGSASRGLGMGHPGLGPLVSAAINHGDLAVFGSFAGRFMIAKAYSHDAPGAGEPPAMDPEVPMPSEDPLPPSEHPMASPPRRATMSPEEMADAGHPAPFVGRHERNELGYSAGVTYGRRHSIGAVLNGTTVISPENSGQTLFTLRTEASFRLTEAGGLSVGTEIPLTEARRFQTTVWSAVAWKF